MTIAPGEPALEAMPARPSAFQRLFRVQETGVILVLVALLVIVGAKHSRFVSVDSLTSLSQQAAFYGIIAIGMVFLLAMSEIDISVGGNYAVCTVVAAVMARDGMNPWLAAFLCVILGTLLGAVNGLLANFFKLPVIIISLGTFTAYTGIALVVSKSSPVSGQPTGNAFYRWLGTSYAKVPAIVYVFVIACVILTVVFRSTRFGFAVRAVGSNQEAARLTGYPINVIRLQVTMLVGALCGISGAFTLAYFGAADPGVGNGFEISVIAAAIIGAPVWLAALALFLAHFGALIISTIAGGLTQFGVSADWSSFATGVVIVGAVGFDAIVRRRSRPGARA